MSENRQRLSIALCTYNGASFLEKQLKSFSSQIRLPDELVICDDKSNDNTIDIIETFIKCAPFPVRLFINDNNVGSTKNFEKVIKLCGGDIIVLSDHDDIWMPEKLKEIEMVFENNPDSSYIISDALIIDKKNRSLGYTTWHHIQFTESQRRRFTEGSQFQVLLKVTSVIAGCHLAFKAKIPNWIFPFPDEFREGFHDTWIISLLSATEYKGVLINKPLIKYRQHSQQASGGLRTGLERLKKSYITQKTAHNRLQLLYSLMLDRLVLSGELTYEIRYLLEEKIKHLGVRQKLHEVPRYKRLIMALQELLSGRYHRFSLGWNSAVRDILV